MNRCAICDYVAGYGSTYTNNGWRGTKVSWNKKTNEYVCSTCRAHINDTVSDTHFDDHIVTEGGFFDTRKDQQGY